MVGNIPSQVPRGEMLMGSVLFLQRARGLPYNNNDAYVIITTKIDALSKMTRLKAWSRRHASSSTACCTSTCSIRWTSTAQTNRTSNAACIQMFP